jgi:cell division protein FtsB
VSGFQPYEGPNEIVERLRAELAAAKAQLASNADELAAMKQERDALQQRVNDFDWGMEVARE